MKRVLFIFISTVLFIGCEKKMEKIKEKKEKVRLMTLDPGHFHAALIQKSMYKEVDSAIYVYAPDGAEVEDFLDKIESYNSRLESPTAWTVKTNLADNYLEKMISDKPGNVVVVAGKNSKKIDYILAAVKAGFNVYADKPLVINEIGYNKLKEAFKIAERNKVIIYDIMTERFEITTRLQKEFSQLPEVFGTLVDGTIEDPSISKESVHHFYKHVSGKPLVRPAWFFDVDEEGDGIVDVTTHLVDLVQWEAFSDQVIDPRDIEMLRASRWPTKLSLEDFRKVTKLDNFPEYLNKDLKDNILMVYSNGEMNYKIKGKHAKVSVRWNFKAPEGTGDTHYSIMRGTKCNLVIKQGVEEKFKSTLYIEAIDREGFEDSLNEALKNDINAIFPGVDVEKIGDSKWKVIVPEKYKIGHEAHFTQVTKNFLNYLEEGALPGWETPNMLAKYHTTIEAYNLAKKGE